MVNRFGNYKNEEIIEHTIGDAKFSSSSVGDGYTLIGFLEGYGTKEQFKFSKKNTATKTLHIGRGLFEIYLLDSEDNIICLEGNKKQIERLFLTNEVPIQEKIIIEKIPEPIINEEPKVIIGTQGEHGYAGADGKDGKDGIQGIQGVQGEVGPQGEEGVQGEEGIQGEVGPEGIQGEVGPQGIQGDEGIQGEVGLRGIQGIQGEVGPQGIQGEQGKDANPPVVAAASPLIYDKKKNTLIIDPKWIQQIPVGQVGGAVIGGGGSNTGVRKDGTLLHPAPQYINFLGDNITAVNNKQNIDVTFVDPQAGTTQITITSQHNTGATTANELGLTDGVLNLRANSPLTINFNKNGNQVQWEMGISKIISSNQSSWSTGESNRLASEGNLATLRDGSHLKGEDINTSGYKILAATMDGGTF